MKLESTIKERAGFLYISPLFDGVLLVLAFFIFSSNWVSKSGVQITPPTSNSAIRDSSTTHVISIVEGTPVKIFFNEARVDMKELDLKLQAEKIASNHVTILADQQTSYNAVMEVALAALKYNYDVALGTKPGRE